MVSDANLKKKYLLVIKSEIDNCVLDVYEDGIINFKFFLQH